MFLLLASDIIRLTYNEQLSMVVNKLKSTRNKQTGFAQMGYIFFQANFTQNTVAKGYLMVTKLFTILLRSVLKQKHSDQANLEENIKDTALINYYLTRIINSN